MKIAFDKLFRTPLGSLQTFILYGNDEGVITRALSFLKHTVSKTHEALIVDDVKSTLPSGPSLFEETTQKLHILSTSSEKIIRAYPLPIGDLAIFIAPSLRAKSPLILEAPSLPTLVAISCYETPLLSDEIQFLAQSYGLPLTLPEVQSLLLHFKDDYETLRNLLHIMAVSSPLSTEEFEALVVEYKKSSDVSAMIPAFLLKNKKTFDRSAAEQNDPLEMIPLLRSFQRAFEILLSKKAGLIPLPHTVFFKDEPTYDRAKQIWSLDEIESVLETLLHLEHDVKFGHIDPNFMTHRMRSYLPV